MTMNNKEFIAVITISIILAGMLVAEVAKANPIPYPPAPNTELPTLTIQTPENYSATYANSTLELNFTVTKPTSWNSYHMGFIPTVGQCWVYTYLDGILKQGFPSVTTTVMNCTAIFKNLTTDQHTARIDVYAMTYYAHYNETNYPQGRGSYQSNVTQTILFTLNADSQTLLFKEYPAVITRGVVTTIGPSSSPSPTPSHLQLPTPTQTLTPTPSPAPTQTGTQSTTPEWVHLTTITGNSSQIVDIFTPNLSHWRATGGVVSYPGDSLLKIAYGNQYTMDKPFGYTKNHNWWIGLEHTNASEQGQGNIQLEITASNILSYTLNVEYDSSNKEITSISPSYDPSSTASTLTSPSPSIPEFPTWIVVPLVLAATLL